MIKLQYQGLSLLDRIATVEITYDERNEAVHIYDEESVVWPEYRGTVKGYVLSDGFYLMTKVLEKKPIFKNYPSKNDSEWLQNRTWFFYKPNAHILCLNKGENDITICSIEEKLCENFVNRIKS